MISLKAAPPAAGPALRRPVPPRPGARRQDDAIEAIRTTLKGDLIEVFRREIPALKSLARDAAYEAVMNDPHRLDQCLRLFRARPELFGEVVVDGQRQPIGSDDQKLSCGRTLAEAIQLVLRAAARRYFRARLDPRPLRMRPAPRLSPFKRLAIWLGLAAPPVKRKPAPLRSESLYRALREYLLFDWQALLIPHYAPLSPALVAELGPRLLDIREGAELQALAGSGKAGLDGRPALLLDDAKRLLVPGNETIDAEVLWRVTQQMDLARLFPKGDITATRRAVAQIATCNPEVIRVLLPVLGGDIRRFTAFLMVAFTSMGEHRFKQTFGHDGQVTAARRVADHLSDMPPPPPCLAEMKQAYEAALAATVAASGGHARDVSDVEAPNAPANLHGPGGR